MSHDIPELDAAGLRRAGLATGAVLAGLFGLLLPWLLGRDLPLWPWLAGGGLAAWGLLAPASLAPLYRLWMRFGAVLGWINSRIILGLLFYAMILPAGLLMRLLGKDPMRRRFDAGVASYRVASKARPADHLEKPF